MKYSGIVNPGDIYRKLPDGAKPVEMFISPSQYIQGHGVLNFVGEYLSFCVSGCAGVLITPGRDRTLGARVEASLKAAGFTLQKTLFHGESTLAEAHRVATFFGHSGPDVNVVIGIGGGKCLDTARMAASRLGVPAVAIPTTASTDAPTAAHAVVYDEHGVFVDVEFCTTNPLMVLADLDIIAAAPPRYLIAGMGDAFSTFPEARCCAENPEARTARGVRPTMAALAIARQCHDLLFDYGYAALNEVRTGHPGDALARIVEANILLSGIGFESGGLAGAHGVAQGLTVCEDLHSRCLHGELVAIGVLTQLIMEKRMDEAGQAIQFFKDIGLPFHLGQIGFDHRKRASELDAIVERSLRVSFLQCEPFAVTGSFLKEAILEADRFGRAME